jgi:hypothetical protein
VVGAQPRDEVRCVLSGVNRQGLGDHEEGLGELGDRELVYERIVSMLYSEYGEYGVQCMVSMASMVY